KSGSQSSTSGSKRAQPRTGASESVPMHHTARAPKEVREAFDIRCFVLPNGTGNALIDLSAVEWISPLGVVALLARCLMATTEGVQIVVKLPSNQRARTYLSRIGFYAAL